MKIKLTSKTLAIVSAVTISAGLIAYTNSSTAEGQNSAFTSTQKAALNKLFKQFINDNPQVIYDSMLKMQAEQRLKLQQDQLKAIHANYDGLFKSGASIPTLGNAKADISVIEFFDYRCGYCKKAAPAMTKLMKNYNQNTSFMFYDLPVLGADSEYAAKASLAAAKQDKYGEFHKMLINSKKRLNKKLVLEYAVEAGLNQAQLEKDMATTQVADQIKYNRELAGKLGINGTPAFLVVDKKTRKLQFFPGLATYDNLSEAITNLRESRNN